MPAGAVYVGRPTKWANPYRVTRSRYVVGPFGDEHYCEVGEAAGVAVRLFREHVAYAHPPYDELDLAELAGHDLACWCPLDRPCHADVLLELANREVG
jgi:Domain of unknown function (DUF4326)